VRTKRLVQRAQPGDIAVIDHEDLDRVSAESLIDADVAGVVNAGRSITGRYPNLGPLMLVEAGVPVIDSVGPLVLRKVREGEPLRLEGDRVLAGERLVGVGVRQDEASVREAMAKAQLSLGERFEGFARNTVDYMQRERDLLFGGSGLPALDHELAGRPVLVVVRGYDYKEDLAVLGSYIRDVHPVLLGVDGGADALIEAGYEPDLILGDMDSVSDQALALALPRSRRWFRRRRSSELVRTPIDGRAPGRERLRASASHTRSSGRLARARTWRSCSRTRRAPRRSWPSAATATFGSSSTRGGRGCRAPSWSASGWGRSSWTPRGSPACTRPGSAPATRSCSSSAR
jgi:uncharacterized membrane-anchored protein